MYLSFRERKKLLSKHAKNSNFDWCMSGLHVFGECLKQKGSITDSTNEHNSEPTRASRAFPGNAPFEQVRSQNTIVQATLYIVNNFDEPLVGPSLPLREVVKCGEGEYSCLSHALIVSHSERYFPKLVSST